MSFNLIKLRRVAWAGLLNFLRAPMVASASVITLTVTLVVVGGLYLGAAFFRASLAAVESRVDISVSFKPDATEKSVLDLKQSLSLLAEVKEVNYSSREAELADFRARNADNSLIIQSLAEVGNPFGARLNIRAADPRHYESIVKFLHSDNALNLGGQAIIDQITFKKDVVDKLIGLIGAARNVGFAATLVLIFLSLVVTFNTISLAIYVSREEISLMELVGASRNYIRGPFLMEGLLAGLLAALLATALLYPATLWIRNQTSSLFGGLNLVDYFFSHFAGVFGLLLLAGVGLGILASFMATRRHLRT